MLGLNPPPSYYQAIPWNSPNPYKPLKYHNLGQLQTPYFGKNPSQLGDYGPPQGINYYTKDNRNYVYPLWNCKRSNPPKGCACVDIINTNPNSYFGLNNNKADCCPFGFAPPNRLS